MDAIKELGLDACIGGGRRDEEKARAKERNFSVRDASGAWKPYNQRPELWDIYNGRIQQGGNVRVFPISNWSELDVWRYIQREKIGLPSLYFSHERECIRHNGRLVAVSEYILIDGSDVLETKNVRYRTVGDMTCTAAVESNAFTVEEVIAEIENTNISERGQTRMDDQLSEAAMEDRKLKGYF
jgi:sulfate adenylyltransferase subunit 2